MKTKKLPKIEKIETKMGRNYPEHYNYGFIEDSGVKVDTSDIVNKINELVEAFNMRREKE
jgi:hypothetical protein